MENTNEILDALRKLIEDADKKKEPEKPKVKPERKFVTIKYSAGDPKSAEIIDAPDRDTESDMAVVAALSKEVSKDSWQVTYQELCKTVARCALADIFVDLLTGGDKSNDE